MKRRNLIAAVTLGAAVALTVPACSSMNQQDRVCTVTGKESVRAGDGNQYRVYTDECQTLVVEDSLTVGRYNSADVYAKIEAGKTYEFRTGGYRNGFFSMFPNIIEVKGEVAP